MFEGEIMGIVLGLSSRRRIETNAAEEGKDDRHAQNTGSREPA